MRVEPSAQATPTITKREEEHESHWDTPAKKGKQNTYGKFQ